VAIRDSGIAGKALLTLAQGEGATLFMALLAAFNALLFRYTGPNRHPGRLADRRPRPARA